MPEATLRPARPADTARVCDIYNHYVRETVVTFEEVPVAASDMAQRMVEVAASAALPWLVAEANGSVAAFAYARPWHVRSAYRFSVESTIYVAPDALGRGIGFRLYGALIEALRTREVHCVLGGIALPNPASVALHEKLGFRRVGRFEEVGWKLGRWVDVGYWELLI